MYGRMNQGGNTQAVAAPLDPNPIENRYGVEGSQVQTSPYQYSTGSDGTSWTTHRVDNQVVQNGNYSNSNYYHPQPPVPATGNVQEALNTASSSTSGTVNVAQDYSGYTPYQAPSDPQNYSNTGYTNYYSGYQQQQPSQSYPQPVVAYQNTDYWRLPRYKL